MSETSKTKSFFLMLFNAVRTVHAHIAAKLNSKLGFASPPPPPPPPPPTILTPLYHRVICLFLFFFSYYNYF
ncbi:MAG: hypothetical protein LBH98_09680, partial [Chitinispirillales bacterium]|nr:hypothetical protein [Chitinispirillales bacterium]